MGKNIYKCPNCGSSLEISDKIDVFFCTYCGVKIYSGDKNRIKAQLKVKEMDYGLEVIKEKNKNDMMGYIFSIIFCLIMIPFILLMFFGINKSDKEEAKLNSGKIQLKQDYIDFVGENYEYVVGVLEDTGFKNIKTVESDRDIPQKCKPGDVDRILIKGDDDFSSGDYFDPDVPIRIYYYKQR